SLPRTAPRREPPHEDQCAGNCEEDGEPLQRRDRRQEESEGDDERHHRVEAKPTAPHENTLSLGSSCEPFCRFSIASRSALESLVGMLTRSRASRSPFPLPFSLGAPRPLTFSIFPSCEPAGTWSATRPSGVGISTVAPSAASAYVTGTSSKRSAPRRSYSGDAATRVTTMRSRGGPPPVPASPLLLRRI